MTDVPDAPATTSEIPTVDRPFAVATWLARATLEEQPHVIHAMMTDVATDWLDGEGYLPPEPFTLAIEVRDPHDPADALAISEAMAAPDSEPRPDGMLLVIARWEPTA